MNAFNAHTVEELIQAFLKAGWDKKIGVIVLTGPATAPSAPVAINPACRQLRRPRHNGMPIEELQSLIRDVPKPVICRVPGYAIGGGNVLATICRYHHCLRQGHLRPGRAAHGLGRPGLRHRLPRARGRREEGSRDLVHVPALLGAGGARHGIVQRRRAGTTSSTPRSPSGARS